MKNFIWYDLEKGLHVFFWKSWVPSF